MRQTLLRITLPEGRPLYASRFRELLAREGNLPPLFFHRAPDGRTLEGQPLVRTVGGKSWVGILGAGEEGANLVEMATGPAIRIASGQMGASLPVTLENHDVGIASSEFLIRYWVRELVIKRRTKVKREADDETLAHETILKGLAAAAEKYHLDGSLFSNDLLFRIEEVRRPRGLRISTSTGETNEYATLMDVEFTMNRALAGIWMVGNLTARGYGRIGRNLGELVNGSGKARSSIK